jgi:hypothetical protein
VQGTKALVRVLPNPTAPSWRERVLQSLHRRRRKGRRRRSSRSSRSSRSRSKSRNAGQSGEVGEKVAG